MIGVDAPEHVAGERRHEATKSLSQRRMEVHHALLPSPSRAAPTHAQWIALVLGVLGADVPRPVVEAHRRGTIKSQLRRRMGEQHALFPSLGRVTPIIAHSIVRVHGVFGAYVLQHVAEA